MELAHTGGSFAIPGGLRIGAGAGPDVVRLIEDGQIVPSRTVIVNTADAVFDANGRDTTFVHLDVDGGDVTIGAGSITVDRVSMDGGLITAAANGWLVLATDGLGVTASVLNGAIRMITGGTLELGPGDHPFQVVSTPEQIDLDITSTIVGPVRPCGWPRGRSAQLQHVHPARQLR